ncbi:MAG TPA: hypothetical protein PKE20_05675, partial [Promineifilum sp.]|nr:hypothetical protein [Promineifilum sp.]
VGIDFTDGKAPVIVRGDGVGLSASPVIPEALGAKLSSAKVVLRLDDPLTSTSTNVDLVGPANGPYIAEFTAPLDYRSSSYRATLALEGTTESGAVVSARSAPRLLTVQRPVGAIQIAPASLQLPTLTGTGSTSSALILLGGKKDGCVWFGPARTVTAPEAAGELKVTYDGKAAVDEGSCIPVGAEATVIVPVEISPSARATGAVRGVIEGHEKTSGAEETVTDVPFRLDLAAGHIYWTDFGLRTLKRMNFDGTNIITLRSNDSSVNEPRGIALLMGPPCYSLARDHTGQGADPTATPGNSAGCPNGQYTAGATIAVNASPNASSAVIGWSGTVNNSSTSTTNTVIMPAANHTVIVHYGDNPDCFALVLQHTGEGNDPIPSPPSSTGCALGLYEEGTLITLTADPAPEWTVQGWSGTTNNSSTGATNTAIMPGGNHTVIVSYAPPPCYFLSLTHEGQGSNPAATPPNSTGCGAGSYHVGAVVSVSATPAAGWEVMNWSGTLDDAGTTTGNFAVMPDGPHTVTVRYRPGATEHSYVPVVYSSPASPPACYPGDFEIEPNNSLTQARTNGPFCFSKQYAGLPTDQWDMFVFDPAAGGKLRVDVTNPGGPDVVLQVYDNNNNRLDYDNDASDGLNVTVTLPAPQRIYVLLFVKAPNASQTAQYVLEVKLE